MIHAHEKDSLGYKVIFNVARASSGGNMELLDLLVNNYNVDINEKCDFVRRGYIMY